MTKRDLLLIFEKYDLDTEIFVVDYEEATKHWVKKLEEVKEIVDTDYSDGRILLILR